MKKRRQVLADGIPVFLFLLFVPSRREKKRKSKKVSRNEETRRRRPEQRNERKKKDPQALQDVCFCQNTNLGR